jgi:hemoglobin-like flavoprotein
MTFAEFFYRHLFRVAPGLRPLFPADLYDQKRKLMAVVEGAVARLDQAEVLIPAVKALGARHAGYGITTEHYSVVGETLLWTLERSLGAAFTPDVKAAWTRTYAVLASTMQAGASEAAALRAAE